MGRDWFRGVGLATVLAASVTAYGQGAPSKGAGAPAGAPAGTGAAVDSDAYDEAAKHYDAGRAALAKNKYEKAIEELKAARKLFPATAQDEIALSLGLLADTEFKAKRYRDAAQHSEEMLRLFGAKLDPPDRKQIEGNLATAKKNVATLKVTVVPPPGAAAGWDAELELLVDKKPFGSKGPLPPEIYVEEGARTLVVRAGEAREEVSGEYKKGTESSVTLTLKVPVVNVAPTATASVAPTAVPTSESMARPALLITGGVAAVGLLGAGAGLALIANGKQADAREQVLSIQAASPDKTVPPCKNPAPAVVESCKKNQDTFNSIDTLGHLGVGLMAGGGLVLALTAVYWLVPTSSKSKTGVVVIPVATANEGGAMIRGSF